MATPENASIPPAEMSEKMRARMQKGAAPLMEPDETVIYGVFNLTMPAALYMAFAGIALLPYVIQKNSMAVVTQKNVYVFKIRVGTKAHRILLKQPLGSV